jgi:hypothetical protein
MAGVDFRFYVDSAMLGMRYDAGLGIAHYPSARWSASPKDVVTEGGR